MDTKSIVICGVGGQGILLASDILSYALFKMGYDVKKNEIHGMSQREGAVTSFIRYGDAVHSPVVSPGEADFLLAFEKLEALRNGFYLKKNAFAVINDLKIPPVSVIMGISEYPENTEEYFSSITSSFRIIDALERVKSLGNARLANTFLLGVLSNAIPEVPLATWKISIKTFVKSQYEEQNDRAFIAGRAV